MLIRPRILETLKTIEDRKYEYEKVADVGQPKENRLSRRLKKTISSKHRKGKDSNCSLGWLLNK
jgi:flagellar biosynthesis/type III secretory pathway chaperone